MGFGDADLLVGLEQAGIGLLILGEVGFEAVLLGGDQVHDKGGCGFLDPLIDIRHLMLEIGLGGGVARGLTGFGLDDEDLDELVGDVGGALGVGVGDGDIEELGVADGGDFDGGFVIRRQVEVLVDFIQDRLGGDDLGVGLGELLGGDDGGVVGALPGFGLVDEEAGGGLVGGGHLAGDEVGGEAGEEGGEEDQPEPAAEEGDVLTDVGGGFH